MILNCKFTTKVIEKWRIENEKLKIENEERKVKSQYLYYVIFNI